MTQAVRLFDPSGELKVRRDRHVQPTIAGTVEPQFERVRVEFERNFRDRGEQGAACTIYHRGVKVVDLWGGYRCSKTRKPWTQRTLSLSFSVTKGLAAAVMAVAHSRGLFDLDQPVATYWPEFGQAEKHRITVRQLLSHQAGVIGVQGRLNSRILADHDLLAKVLARQKPQWTPGTRHGYHTLTLGWYQSELIRRVDPQHRSLGKFFQDEIASRLGVEYYIGLPKSVDLDRVSTIDDFPRVAMLAHLRQLPVKMVLSGIWPGSLVAKSVHALRIGKPSELCGPDFRGVEIPAANGIGQAQAVARIYDVLARGGDELGITSATFRELVAPPVAPALGTDDAILRIDTQYGFGFSRPSGGFRFGVDDGAFGAPGAGGSFGMADPTAQLGFAYLTNKMGFRLFDDPRELAVREACYASLSAASEQRSAA